jgi:hypothetical protein
MRLFDRIRIEGLMPERALLRLKREGIPLYSVKKIQKNAILLTIPRKDRQKVFAIYPNVCYNETIHRAYTTAYLGGVGLARVVDFCKNRAGIILGVLAFCILTLGADSFVFGIDFVGTSVYARETAQVLEESGVRLFAPYKKGAEDIVSAKLLALDFVEFCSVQKVGNRLRVEIRTSPFQSPALLRGQMQAKHTGEIIAITVLRGSALKKIGETVTMGESLVGDWFLTVEGEQVRVEPIARVRIACVYEGAHEGAQSKEQAFAQAYLALGLTEKDEVCGQEITQTDNGFHVKISYIVTESMNL